eukprot:m.383113 g.383113  ORF g.383113 m.383113 type:complete len:59 (+) comp20981_c0_seq3:417-593(+)
MLVSRGSHFELHNHHRANPDEPEHCDLHGVLSPTIGALSFGLLHNMNNTPKKTTQKLS